VSARDERVEATAVGVAADQRLVVDLSDSRCLDPASVGAKAANLARAGRARLPVLPGFVLTTGADPADPDVAGALRTAWGRLGGADRALVVRSSSPLEDAASSSMAGRFRSVVGVSGWSGFCAAVQVVRDSASVAGAGDASRPAPMGVLVQPLLAATRGGVLFGTDPITGRRDRVVVEGVAGGPEALVAGRVSAQRWELTPRGRTRSVDGHPADRARRRAGASPLLTDGELRQLARLARRTAEVFGAPQDLEWALDADDRLWLLQARPVTALGPATTLVGPLLGPGPVAETFPLPLGRLEQDLWADPLREGIGRALRETRAWSRARIAASPVLVVIGGWAAVDLQLLGYAPHDRSWLTWLDPRPGARRLRGAVGVGRLRAQLPGRVAALLSNTDTALAAVPRLGGLDEPALLDLLRTWRERLVSLHEAEVGCASLIGVSGSSAAVALQVLAAARAQGLDDARAVQQHQLLLTLVPPRVGGPHPLPASVHPPWGVAAAAAPGPRELVRLRARWVQELMARAADELGRRAASDGRLTEATSVADLSLEEVAALVAGTGAPRARAAGSPGPPLPVAFRLTATGEVVAVTRPGVRPSGGVGAGGGRGAGPVVHPVPGRPLVPGSVAVVRTLDPALADELSGLAGLVSETGGTLAHLAILAREYAVPTVVGVHDAVHRFPVGTRLLVDGTTGEVRPLTEESGPTTEGRPA